MVKRKKQASVVSKVLLAILGVVVIGILAGYYFVKKEVVEPMQQSVSTTEGKARDAARKSEVRSYSSGLEIYKDQNGSYPISMACSSPQTLNLEMSNPAQDPLRDPSYSTQDSSWPEFCYQSDQKGTKFTVWAKFENSGDEKTSQMNTTPYFSVPAGFEPNYYFMQSEE